VTKSDMSWAEVYLRKNTESIPDMELISIIASPQGAPFHVLHTSKGMHNAFEDYLVFVSKAM